MEHTNTIFIVLGISLPCILGACASYLIINHYTSPASNLLIRRGDIELNDYVEPSITIPEEVHQSITFERVPSSIPTDQISCRTNFPSSDRWVEFNSPDGQLFDEYWFNINSCLENENIINPYFIWGIIFIMMILIIYYILFRVKRNNENKIVFTEGVSTNIITFTQDYQDLLSSKITDGINYDIIYDSHLYYTLPHHWTLFDIKDWLDTLNEQDYAVTFHLSCVPSQELYYNTPEIILTNEFVANKSSNPALISVLLYQQLDFFYNSFNVAYYENHFILIRYRSLKASH